VVKLLINYKRNLQLDFRLVYEERAGDIIFLIGTILAIVSTYQAEQSLIDKLFMTKSSEDSVYTITTASWLFFIASLIFTHVAIRRFGQLRKSNISSTSYATIRSSRFITVGDIIKVIGFGLAAIGNQIRTNSLSRTSAISQ
jgi:hypothetical protein